MRIQRYVLALTSVSLLTGCAGQGARPNDGGPDPAQHPTSAAQPALDAVPCALAEVAPHRSARAAASAAPAASGPIQLDPNVDEQYRGELLSRQMEANDAFRKRGTLPDSAVRGAARCAVLAEDALAALAKNKVYDVPKVRKALAAAGLGDAEVRAPGWLDLGPGDGVVFSTWTGPACVFGFHSPKYGTTVEYGTRVADGGCSPAAN